MANASSAGKKWRELLKLSRVEYGYLPQLADQLSLQICNIDISITRKKIFYRFVSDLHPEISLNEEWYAINRSFFVGLAKCYALTRLMNSV